MRQVGLFYDAEEAQVAAGFLRSHGLDASLPDEQSLSVMPELRFGLGGYRLLVPDGEAFRAEALLREVRGGPSGMGPCEACGADALRRRRDWTFPAIIAALLGGLFPFAPATASLRCRACGHTQASSDDAAEPVP